MAKYKSKYQQFGFYVDGERHKFANGVFSTEDKKVQAVLDKLVDAQRVEDESKPKQKPAKAEASSPKSKPKINSKNAK
jgi:hypothetical protein